MPESHQRAMLKDVDELDGRRLSHCSSPRIATQRAQVSIRSREKEPGVFGQNFRLYKCSSEVVCLC